MKISIFIVLLVFCLTFFSCNESDSPIFFIEPMKEELKVGKTPGTYHFFYTNSIKWTQEPYFPVYVILVNSKNDEVIKQIEIFDEKPFSIEIDLKPGEYSIFTKFPAGRGKNYNNSIGKVFTIDKEGKILGTDFELKHEKAIELIYPVNNIEIKEKKPILKWNFIKNADFYEVIWSYKVNKKRITNRDKTETNEYHITKEINSSVKVSWTVVAYDNSKKILGQNFNFFKVK